MYKKLVRDNIPNIIKDNGQVPIIKVLSDEEFKIELEKKLEEEKNEVLNSGGKDRLEELADLYEVIKCLSELEGSSIEKVREIAKIKRNKRGSFNNKIYLVGVENEK